MYHYLYFIYENVHLYCHFRSFIWHPCYIKVEMYSKKNVLTPNIEHLCILFPNKHSYIHTVWWLSLDTALSILWWQEEEGWFCHNTVPSPLWPCFANSLCVASHPVILYSATFGDYSCLTEAADRPWCKILTNLNSIFTGWWPWTQLHASHQCLTR